MAMLLRSFLPDRIWTFSHAVRLETSLKQFSQKVCRELECERVRRFGQIAEHKTEEGYQWGKSLGSKNCHLHTVFDHSAKA